MKSGKTTVFAVMLGTIFLGSIFSVNAAAKNNQNDQKEETVGEKSFVEKILNVDSTTISGSENGDESEDVMEQLETIMTYEDIGAFKTVYVTAGKYLINDESGEFILREGRATAYCDGFDGLIDLTSGKEYYNGVEIQKNHLLVATPVSVNGAYVLEDAEFLVKGSYEIK